MSSKLKELWKNEDDSTLEQILNYLRYHQQHNESDAVEKVLTAIIEDIESGEYESPLYQVK